MNPQIPSPAAPILIITFNLRNSGADDGPNSWRYRSAWVPRFVAGLGADIVGVQEAYLDQVQAMETGLPGFVRTGVGRDDGALAGEHCALYYRSDRFTAEDQGTFWFSDTPDVPGSRTWGNTLPRICSWVCLRDRRTGGRLRACNLHLDHAHDGARLKSVEMLADRIAGWGDRVAVAVMGDFNAGEADPVVRHLQQAATVGLIDTYRACHPTEEGVGTYHNFDGSAQADKIDYILVSPWVTVLDATINRATVDGRHPSDHYPVTATIALAGRKQ